MTILINNSSFITHAAEGGGDIQSPILTLVLRPEDFSSNNSLYNTDKSPGLTATLFDKEGLNFRNFITPFIKGGC